MYIGYIEDDLITQVVMTARPKRVIFGLRIEISDGGFAISG